VGNLYCIISEAFNLRNSISRNVLEVVAALKDMEPEVLSEIVYENTEKVFFSKK